MEDSASVADLAAAMKGRSRKRKGNAIKMQAGQDGAALSLGVEYSDASEWCLVKNEAVPRGRVTPKALEIEISSW